MVWQLSHKIERITSMELERGSPSRMKPQLGFHTPTPSHCTNPPSLSTSSPRHSHISHHPCIMPSRQHSSWTPYTGISAPIRPGTAIPTLLTSRLLCTHIEESRGWWLVCDWMMVMNLTLVRNPLPCCRSSRVEKRKLLDPVGALKEKFLRPSPPLFHPQVSLQHTANLGI